MFRSIRWRLVASYTLLTLLSVVLVGILSLSLIQRHLEEQETEYLTNNAVAMARQAARLMWPVQDPSHLQSLVRTAAFLGSVQVKILDREQRIVVDSGPPDQLGEVAWLVQSGAVNFRAVQVPPPTVFMLPYRRMAGTSLRPSAGEFGPMHDAQPLASDVEVLTIRRVPGPWGMHLSFEAEEPEWLPEGEGVHPMTLDVPKEEPGERVTSSRIVSVPIGPEADPLGYVELSNGPDFGAQSLATIQRAFLMAAGGVLLLAVAVALLVARGLTAPLHGLAVAAGRMGGGDLSARAPVRSADEIGDLAYQFNRMAERLEASFADLARERDALRRFVANASHELRTPITALKTFNELLMGAAAHDTKAQAEFLAESQVQVARLEWITGNLLDLSRLDAGLVDLDVGEHEAGELLTAAAASFRAAAQRRNITLAIQEPATAINLRCDSPRLELALSNLVDNAVKFTPVGGRVELGAGQERENVYIWVEDDGPGIDSADLPHIFERFYRGTGAVARGGGLGLAIVQSIVQAHGGQVQATSSPGQGSRFVIVLPAAGDACQVHAPLS